MKKIQKLMLAVACLFIVSAAPAQAQSEPFLGQIIWVGFNFCPNGWAEAAGQIMAINQNTALFSLLGTTYGGNGQTTFALPDLRSRFPLGADQGPGLTNRILGEAGGQEQVTLTLNQIPSHSHALEASSDNATQPDPSGNVLAKSGTYRSGGNMVQLNPNAIGAAGGSQPHNNMPPYLTLTPCIALQGIFPSRP